MNAPARNAPQARSMPHDLAAEMSVLGGCMFDPPAISRAAALCSAEDFYREAHQSIYSAMVAMDEKGEAVDLVTLAAEMRRADTLERAGGTPYLAAVLDAVPTAANVTHYARIVREKATRRAYIVAAQETLEAAYADGETLAEFSAGTEDRFAALARGGAQGEAPEHIKAILKRRYEAYEARLAGAPPEGVVPTGLTELDVMLNGGLRNGGLYVVAGRPGTGKTSLMLGFLRNAARSGHPAALFSLEMTKDELADRMLASEAGVNESRLRGAALHENEWNKVTPAAQQIVSWPIYIDDTGALPLAALRSKMRDEVRKHGAKVAAVDYLQLVTVPGGGKRDQTRERDVAEISGTMKALAKELKIPVVVLSQMGRGVEKREDGKPKLSDLRESGAIEADADAVLFIDRPETRSDDPALKGQAEIIVGKHRGGATGAVKCAWEGQFCRFVDGPESPAYDF